MVKTFFFFCPLVVVLDEILNKECKNQIVHAQARRLTVFSFSSVWYIAGKMLLLKSFTEEKPECITSLTASQAFSASLTRR